MTLLKTWAEAACKVHKFPHHRSNPTEEAANSGLQTLPSMKAWQLSTRCWFRTKRTRQSYTTSWATTSSRRAMFRLMEPVVRTTLHRTSQISKSKLLKKSSTMKESKTKEETFQMSQSAAARKAERW